jgi:glucose/arabinose dehydrogenase
MDNLYVMAGGSGRGLRAAGAAALLIALIAVHGGSASAQGGGELKLTRIGGNFDFPVYVDDAPGSSKLLFVVEQPGTIKVIRGGKTLNGAFLNLRNRVRYGGEQGLLSIAFDPGYARNRRFYVYYVNRAGNIEIDGFRRSANNATKAKKSSREKVIVIQHPNFENHNGGQLQFGPGGHLYLGTGDGGSGGDPAGNAQNKKSLLGKLLRIDPRKNGGYSVPKSNPFRRGGKDEIYALGLRNPYRFSFDSRTDDIYIGDVGEGNWEEVDRAGKSGLRAANFGWDLFEGDHAFEGGGAPPNYHPPIFEYSSANGTDNCAITGGYVVRDPSVPALEGRYVYSDYCNSVIRSFDPDNPGPSDSSTGLIPSPGAASSFGEGRGGQIYVVSHSGPVYKLVQG